ncbi:MAG: hypothetical protein LC715_04445, partial [Gammaproteobacteria bacterium]|nr:hypothetical protein [Gammaproteobacteria bacterium]
QLQCGDAIAGDSALAAAMGAFRKAAEQTPVAGWPRRFWALLLASPQLRQSRPAPHWPAELAPMLSRLGSGSRAALLLRLLTGLPEADAAAVLGISPSTYRLGLQRALPHRADGGADEAAWRKVGAALQQAVRQLPAARLAHLAQLREAAVHGLKPGRVPAPRLQLAGAAGQRSLLRQSWPGLALCALAFVATFLLPDDLRPPSGEPRIRIAALPPAEAPAATFDADAALLTHRDFELLHDVAGEAIARELAFYAWYAAELAVQRPADAPQPLLLPDAAHSPATAPAGANHDRSKSDHAPH